MIIRDFSDPAECYSEPNCRDRSEPDGSPTHWKGSHGLPIGSPVQRETILDFDALVTLEQNLQRVVEPIAEVDGHDIGSGEINIFVFTADPVATFERAKMLLSDASLLDKVGSAYRDLQSDKYTVIWPESSAEVFTIA